MAHFIELTPNKTYATQASAFYDGREYGKSVSLAQQVGATASGFKQLK